jgi:hypothetical protein
MLKITLSMSERLACKAVGLARSTYRRLPLAQTPADPDAEMRAWLRAYAGKHPCHGFRRAWAALRYDERREVNKKKIHRLWREEGLQVRVHSRASGPECPRFRRSPPTHRTWCGRSTSSSTPPSIDDFLGNHDCPSSSERHLLRRTDHAPRLSVPRPIGPLGVDDSNVRAKRRNRIYLFGFTVRTRKRGDNFSNVGVVTS